MTIDRILVLITGFGLIGFIWWFFFGKKEEASAKKEMKTDSKGNLNIDIIVDGGYKPAVLFLEKGKNVNLNILRKDSNTCLSDIILPDFKISKYLPLNKKVQIKLKTDKEGEFPFHCGMNMFHGKIVVSE